MSEYLTCHNNYHARECPSASIVMTYIVMAYIVMAYIVMAYIAMA